MIGDPETSVNREPEFLIRREQALQTIMTALAKQGETPLITVSGPSGVGKSDLAGPVLRQAIAMTAGQAPVLAQVRPGVPGDSPALLKTTGELLVQNHPAFEARRQSRVFNEKVRRWLLRDPQYGAERLARLLPAGHGIFTGPEETRLILCLDGLDKLVEPFADPSAALEEWLFFTLHFAGIPSILITMTYRSWAASRVDALMARHGKNGLKRLHVELPSPGQAEAETIADRMLKPVWPREHPFPSAELAGLTREIREAARANPAGVGLIPPILKRMQQGSSGGVEATARELLDRYLQHRTMSGRRAAEEICRRMGRDGRYILNETEENHDEMLEEAFRMTEARLLSADGSSPREIVFSPSCRELFEAPPMPLGGLPDWHSDRPKVSRNQSPVWVLPAMAAAALALLLYWTASPSPETPLLTVRQASLPRADFHPDSALASVVSSGFAVELPTSVVDDPRARSATGETEAPATETNSLLAASDPESLDKPTAEIPMISPQEIGLQPDAEPPATGTESSNWPSAPRPSIPRSEGLQPKTSPLELAFAMPSSAAIPLPETLPSREARFATESFLLEDLGLPSIRLEEDSKGYPAMAGTSGSGAVRALPPRTPAAENTLATKNAGAVLEEQECIVAGLLHNPEAPLPYRELIRGSDRLNSSADLHFESNGIAMTSASEQQIEELAYFLKQPGHGDFLVILAGFADNVGTMRNNLKVSRKRAEQAGRLLQERGIVNIIFDGFGEALPVASNRSPEGREANRRVEVWIRRQQNTGHF